MHDGHRVCMSLLGSMSILPRIDAGKTAVGGVRLWVPSRLMEDRLSAWFFRGFGPWECLASSFFNLGAGCGLLVA